MLGLFFFVFVVAGFCLFVVFICFLFIILILSL